MYAVSDEYKAMMNETYGPEVKAEMDIIRIDGYVQSRAGLTDLSGKSYLTMLSMSAEPVQGIATLEKDYMIVGREYTLVDTPYYMSPVLSAASPSGDGYYAIASCGIKISYTNVNSRNYYDTTTVTLVTDGAVAKVRAQKGTYSHDYVADGTKVVLDGLPAGTEVLTITVLAIKGPYRRAHIHRAYMGDIIRYSNRDIVSLDMIDINDGLCLELPQKTVTVEVDNLSGRYDAETEYTSPTFQRFYTRGLIRLSLGRYTIPLGSYYLDSYTVDAVSVKFKFVDPLAVLNEYTHWWSSTTTKNADGRIQEVVCPNLQLLDIVTDQYVLVPAEKFGICASLDHANHLHKVSTPPPPVSGAQVIQLVCNLTDNYIVQCRMPNYIHNAADIYIALSSFANVNDSRRLSSNDFFSVQWGVPDKIGLYTADVTTVSTEMHEETLADRVLVHVTYDDPVYAYNQPISDLNIVDPDGYGIIRTAAFAYAAYYRRKEESGYVGPATAQLKKLIKTTHSVSYGDGTEKKLSNPLLCNDEYVTADDYIGRMRKDLQYGLCCTLSHRGYPELDAGDILPVQYKNGGAYVKSRVLENRITVRNGSMSGTTKVRRLA